MAVLRHRNLQGKTSNYYLQIKKKQTDGFLTNPGNQKGPLQFSEHNWYTNRFHNNIGHL